MIYQDECIRVEQHESDLPWVKIFAQKPFRELSQCDEVTRARLFEAILITEKTMLKFYQPTKVNIASFGNVLPQVHIHVMARFENDSHFPNNLWEQPLRSLNLNLPSFDEFAKILKAALDER